jgi:hypothetical protein
MMRQIPPKLLQGRFRDDSSAWDWMKCHLGTRFECECWFSRRVGGRGCHASIPGQTCACGAAFRLCDFLDKARFRRAALELALTSVKIFGHAAHVLSRADGMLKGEIWTKRGRANTIEPHRFPAAMMGSGTRGWAQRDVREDTVLIRPSSAASMTGRMR